MRYQVVLGRIALSVEIDRRPGSSWQKSRNGHYSRPAFRSSTARQLVTSLDRKGKRQGLAAAEHGQVYLEQERLLAAARSFTDYWARTLLANDHDQNLR